MSTLSWRTTWNPKTNDYNIDINGVINHSDVEGKTKLLEKLRLLVSAMEPSDFDVSAEADAIQKRWAEAVK